MHLCRNKKIRIACDSNPKLFELFVKHMQLYIPVRLAQRCYDPTYPDMPLWFPLLLWLSEFRSAALLSFPNPLFLLGGAIARPGGVIHYSLRLCPASPEFPRG